MFSLGHTFPILQKCGMPALDVVMTQFTVHKVMRPKEDKRIGHGLSRLIMKDLKKQLENPVIVLNNPKENALVIVTGKKDKDNLPVIVAIHKNESIAFKKRNVIKSIYGRNGFEKYLLQEAQKGNMVFIDKKRAEKLCRSVPLQLREETSTISYNNNIP